MKGALENITKAVGNTPIVKLNRVAQGVAADIYVKCEYLNPGGSHKDRIALNMIDDAEEAGLKPGGTIVEATSGNTGASLALIAAIKRLQVHLRDARQDVAGEDRQPARVRRARSSCARPRSSPTIRAATTRSRKRIADETPNSLLREPVPQPREPRGSLPLDRPRDLGADRRRARRVRAPAWAPAARSAARASTSRRRSPTSRSSASIRSARSTTTSSRRGRITKPFTYKVEGIGEDFFPTTMNLKILDEIVRVDDKECFS